MRVPINNLHELQIGVSKNTYIFSQTTTTICYLEYPSIIKFVLHLAVITKCACMPNQQVKSL